MAIKNKTVFILGASTGIGFALACELAKHNNTLCLFARDEKKLERAKNQIEQTAAKGPCHIFSADAKNYEALKSTLETVVKEIGAPDIMINCVGRAYPDHFENITPEMMQDTMQTNFGSIWNAAHIIVPFMKVKGGKIVNTSSVAGFMGVFGYADYSASKFAIIGFSEVLRQEVAKYNIDVQVICPPDTDTPGYEAENRSKPEETKKISESGKVLSPEEVARQAIKGIESGKFIILPGIDSKLSYWLKRYSPFILDGIISRAIRQVKG